MVVELCARNYATYDGLVNGVDGVFKTSTSYHNKTIVWILFPNKIKRMLVKENLPTFIQIIFNQIGHQLNQLSKT
jgi:hypothetical protein